MWRCCVLLMRCSQCCEYFSVALPDVQLAVTEQRMRSWAAAAAQLQVQITVLNPPASDAAKKPAGAAAAAGGAKGPPAPAAVATGTLLVNCAGLLTGDTSAAYLWGKPPPAAAVQDAASREGSAATAAGAVAGVHAPAQQAAAAATAGQAGKFKWEVQAPNGTLPEWLESAEAQVQVRPDAGNPLCWHVTCSSPRRCSKTHLSFSQTITALNAAKQLAVLLLLF